MGLFPCDACRRHIRATTACPFCGALIKLTALAAAAALAVTACGDTKTDKTRSRDRDPEVMPPYGVSMPPPPDDAASSPPVDAGVDASQSPDASGPTDAGVDASKAATSPPDAGPKQRDPRVVPPYGVTIERRDVKPKKPAPDK